MLQYTYLREHLIMPIGPTGERRPVDVVGCAVHVAKIATVEIEDAKLKFPTKHNNGVAGSKVRAISLSKSKLTDIAKKSSKCDMVAVRQQKQLKQRIIDSIEDIW